MSFFPLQEWNLKKCIALKSFYHPDYSLLWSLLCLGEKEEEFKIEEKYFISLVGVQNHIPLN